jgi:hypothetical protein
MTQSTQDHQRSPSNESLQETRAITLDDVRELLDELAWFYTRDWRNIVKDPTIATALIRRSTRAALYAEDIHTDLIQGLAPVQDPDDIPLQPVATTPDSPSMNGTTYSLSFQPEAEDPPRVTSIPISVDRVELFDMGVPHPHEHPLYKDHVVMGFCAAFYHEDEFIFARAHLQLLLTPTGTLNWLAGSRSVPIDKNFLPLPYVPGGELFHLLGLGISQLIYTNQTDLKMRMKQGQRLPTDYKLVGMVFKNELDTSPSQTPSRHETTKPTWLNS